MSEIPKISPQYGYEQNSYSYPYVTCAWYWSGAGEISMSSFVSWFASGNALFFGFALAPFIEGPRSNRDGCVMAASRRCASSSGPERDVGALAAGDGRPTDRGGPVGVGAPVAEPALDAAGLPEFGPRAPKGNPLRLGTGGAGGPFGAADLEIGCGVLAEAGGATGGAAMDAGGLESVVLKQVGRGGGVRRLQHDTAGRARTRLCPLPCDRYSVVKVTHRTRAPLACYCLYAFDPRRCTRCLVFLWRILPLHAQPLFLYNLVRPWAPSCLAMGLYLPPLSSVSTLAQLLRPHRLIALSQLPRRPSTWSITLT